LHFVDLYLIFFRATQPHLVSFPTRRSSDLLVEQAVHAEAAGIDRLARMRAEILDQAFQLAVAVAQIGDVEIRAVFPQVRRDLGRDRKSTRLNSSHVKISYAVFCLKKKKLIQ